jgi:SAM-dependent MidA family methyltransferase
MQEWLYGTNGYYTKKITIGKEGDFYTAVSSSMFFGGSIANRLLQVIDERYLTKRCVVVEIGAHKGYLLADMVQFIYTLRPKLLDTIRFMIVEPQEESAKLQIEYFKSSFGDVVKLEHKKSLDEVEEEEAFVVANEIFDAFSCEVINDDTMLFMNGHKPYFDKQSLEIEKIVKMYGFKRGEIGLGYGEFARSMQDAFKRYEFVTFDYGDRKQRVDFSLRIYHKHHTYPFFSLTDFVDEKEKARDITLAELYKNSDITYDVNFNYLIDEFTKQGIKLVWYKTQLSALVEFGIDKLLEMLARNTDEKTYKSELNRVKILISPSFMGERFKCVVFRGKDESSNKWRN